MCLVGRGSSQFQPPEEREGSDKSYKDEASAYLVLNPSSVCCLHAERKELTGLNFFEGPLQLRFFFFVAAEEM
jgi:hypothetical protein